MNSEEKTTFWDGIKLNQFRIVITSVITNKFQKNCTNYNKYKLVLKVMNQIIARKEHFGHLIFDRKKLNHKFVDLLEPLPPNTKLLPEKLYERKDILSAPVRIYWELTNKCNLSCTHCFNSSGKPLDNELSFSQIIKTLQGIVEDNIPDVRFSGGELTQR